MPKHYKKGKRLKFSLFCKGVCEERTWEGEAEECPLLEAVVRERLVKTADWNRLSECCSDL
jgi:hypothetical protein